MAVQTIRLLGDEILRQRCALVKRFGGSDLKRIAADLNDTLGSFRRSKGFGRGIAAPQIGVPERVLLINIDGPVVFVNPVIRRRSRLMMTLWDDCFSFPDIMVKVRRNAKVEIEYQDLAGTKHSVAVSGDRSELLQHEIDHLDGVLAIDRAIDSRHIVLRSEWEKNMEARRHGIAL